MGETETNQKTYSAKQVKFFEKVKDAYRGFFGCNHFNIINEKLVAKGKTPIDWNVY